MTVLGNLLWLLVAGLWLSVSYAAAGLMACLTVIGIPFGVQALELAGYALWPFGRVVVERPGRYRALGLVGNVLWLLLGGWWIALFQVALGLLLVLTVVGIPFGIASFRMAVLALLPFDKSVVAEDAVPAGAVVVVGPVRRRR